MKRKSKVSKLDLKNIPLGEPDKYLRPMLATLIDRPFTLEDWIFEIKWDGYRAIAQTHGKEVRLYSRNQKPFEEEFPEVVRSLKQIRYDVVLDGEIVAVDHQGNSKFSLLQKYQRNRRGDVRYMVFDLLFIDGRDLRDLPLRRRKELLRQVLPSLPNVKMVDYCETKGLAFYRQARDHGTEGIVAKAADSTYCSGKRNGKWLKIKTHLRQEFVIGGYTIHPDSALASLLVGVFAEGRLHFVGKVETGFEGRAAKSLLKKLQHHRHSVCLFENLPISHAHSFWVLPELVCEVSFRRWSSGGLLLQPWYDGLRIDKAAALVKREKPKSVARVLRDKTTDVAHTGLRLVRGRANSFKKSGSDAQP